LPSNRHYVTCDFNMRRCGVLLVLAVVVLSTQKRVSGQDKPCEPRLLPISLVGPKATFLSGFGISDISLKSRTFGVKGISVEPDSRFRRVVIALDVSGSMAGDWKIVTEFMRHVALINTTRTQFALVLFSDRILESIDFSRDRGAVQHRLEEISDDPKFGKQTVHGRTALFDALQSGFLLIDSPTSADVLFVITDGNDTASRARGDDILQMLIPPMVRVFALLFEHRRNVLPGLELPPAKDFRDLVYESGGGVFGPILIENSGHFTLSNPDLLDRPIPDELMDFYRTMLENPVLTVQTTPASDNAASLDIALSTEGRKHWKHANLLYPHLIGTCPVATVKKD
jgi:hypothetical protein